MSPVRMCPSDIFLRRSCDCSLAFQVGTPSHIQRVDVLSSLAAYMVMQCMQSICSIYVYAVYMQQYVVQQPSRGSKIATPLATRHINQATCGWYADGSIAPSRP
jgi:hypothetical protein